MKEKLMKNMGNLIAIVDMLLYFVLSFVFIDGFDKNIMPRIAEGLLVFIGAIIASNALMKQGLINGGENQRYKDTLVAHLDKKKKIYPKLKNLQPWLDKDYFKLLKLGRTVYVSSAGYDYNEIFDEEGKVKSGFNMEKPKPYAPKRKLGLFLWMVKWFRWMFGEDWRVYRHKKALVRKAKHYKITRLAVVNLMNIYADDDPNDFGMTEKQYVKKQSGLNLASRVIFSFLLPLISWGWKGFSKEALIVQGITMLVVLISALFSMFSAYSFKIKDHRESIVNKINKMEEFDNETADVQGNSNLILNETISKGVE